MTNLNSAIFEKPSCKFRFLERSGFYTPQYYELQEVDEVLILYKKYMTSVRDSLEYDIDGLVQEVDDYDAQKKLGYQPNGLNPKFATSIKFDSLGGTSTLLDIRWTVGMTGRIIPTAIFEPVDIMGATIEKASMHNFDILTKMISQEGLCIGSTILVARKGDVIPQVEGVIKDGSHDVTKLKQVVIPSKCPECASDLVVFSADLVCEDMECPAKIRGIFTNLFTTLDIKGISDKFVDKVIDAYNVTTIDQLMSLTLEQIEQLPGFAKKSAKNAYDAIHSVKEVTPEQFFALLNIPNQGVRVFENLFSQFPVDSLLDASFKPEDILSTKGIAEKTAKAIHAGIQANLDNMRKNAKWFTITKKLKNSTAQTNHKSNMVGKSFCITGSLNNGSRTEYETKIKNAGGIVSGVSKKLNYLITNDTDSTSSKMKKVLEINAELHNSGADASIIIMSEAEFTKMLESA